jgi:hypothetical protein
MRSDQLLQVAGLGVTCAAAVACLAAGRRADVEAVAAFERLKSLQGMWEAPSTKGQKATTVFELTAGGTVLLGGRRDCFATSESASICPSARICRHGSIRSSR